MCSRKDSAVCVTQLPMFSEPSVIGWYFSPIKVHILILRTCDYVTLYNKRGFEDVIKFSSLRWSDYSRLLGGALCNHRGPYKRDIGGLYSKSVIYLEKQVCCSLRNLKIQHSWLWRWRKRIYRPGSSGGL